MKLMAKEARKRTPNKATCTPLLRRMTTTRRSQCSQCLTFCTKSANNAGSDGPNSMSLFLSLAHYVNSYDAAAALQESMRWLTTDSAHANIERWPNPPLSQGAGAVTSTHDLGCLVATVLCRLLIN